MVKSMFRCCTAVRKPARFAETPPTIRPVPLPTEKAEAVPLRLQAPPMSATPRPLEVVRPKASNAYSGGGFVTVTGSVMLPVSPTLSVTVSVTSYVPPVA